MNRLLLATIVFLAALQPIIVLGAGDAAARLTAQGKQFEERIFKIADNAYTAVGYSVSNVSMIVGDDGVVIIDTGMTLDDAGRIAEKFRKITDLPVKAIIFTHSHGDHTGGAAAFLGESRPQIWAHENFGSEARGWVSGDLTVQKIRGARQAGFLLPSDQRINNGVAPVRYPNRGGAVFSSDDRTSPTHFLRGDQQSLNIAGIELELVSSPGETNDQLFVWYPAGKALFAGDNFYRSFPNLYAIRGTPNRSVRLWADSLQKLADHHAQALVGGHTNPVLGAQKVNEVLSDYHNAVRFIHDKTVEGMNQGMTPDQLVEYVQLPDDLAAKDHLQPFYGHPEWGIRSVFNGYLGWFDGNATHLFPLSPKAEAQRVADLAGGPDQLTAKAHEAVASGDSQWAAQLADHLLAIEPNDREAKQIKAQALTQLAQDMVNATARNYYLTVAAELRGDSK
ncbi:alkyl/aryl-sulfatase [Crateriforma conspicua]|uniref:alkyl/aryl-sulfatase n=1 Tax=Crateriforma conspicua TaxID=2527996 RepID=UPI00118BEDA2|nr:alkyl/aryl-sulfatase [Crateriforma conspicua]QDV64002.1 Hydroxyacylglutathione hydrolase [Crateriforma conspicua]